MRDVIPTEEEEVIRRQIVGDGHHEDQSGASADIGNGDGRDGGGRQLTEEMGHSHQLGGLQISIRIRAGGGGGGGSEGGVERLREVDGVEFEGEHLLPFLFDFQKLY